MKDFRPKEWSLAKRILATVAYFDIFDIPLRESELSRLIWGSADFNPLELEVALAEVAVSLKRENGLYYLRGREPVAQKLQERELLKNRLLRRARRSRWIFRSCPFVEFAAVCNYLPIGAVEEYSDIDLLIVTKPGRIFTARLFLTLLAQIGGLRRHHDKVEGRLCLSFYLNRNSLALAPLLLNPHDVYMAYWLLALLPIYGEAEIGQALVRENDQWLSAYFDFPASRFHKEMALSGHKNLVGRILEFILKRGFGSAVERYLGRYFIKRHERNLENLPENASVEVSDQRLKFHNNDKRAYFRDEYERRLKGLQLL